MKDDLFENDDFKWPLDIIVNGCYAVCTNLTADDIDKIIEFAKKLESEEQK